MVSERGLAFHVGRLKTPLICYANLSPLARGAWAVSLTNLTEIISKGRATYVKNPQNLSRKAQRAGDSGAAKNDGFFQKRRLNEKHTSNATFPYVANISSFVESLCGCCLQSSLHKWSYATAARKTKKHVSLRNSCKGQFDEGRHT
jgi:hypothetical protein